MTSDGPAVPDPWLSQLQAGPPGQAPAALPLGRRGYHEAPTQARTVARFDRDRGQCIILKFLFTMFLGPTICCDL